jgi:hypothetical protein
MRFKQMDSIEKEVEIDRLYHEILENLNRVYSHAIMRGVPFLQEYLSAAANGVKRLREFKEN